MNPDRLRAVPLFAQLPEGDLRRLADSARVVELAAGEQLFAEGDEGHAAYVIAGGEIEIVKTSDGREVLLSVRRTDEMIGEMALLETTSRFATARAKTDVRLIEIPKAEIDALLDSSIAAVRALFGVLLERWKATQAHLKQSERMAQLGTLTAGLAHELNNPAAAAGRAASSLREAVDQLVEAERDLHTGIEGAEAGRLVALVDAIHPPERRFDLDPLERSDEESRVEDLLRSAGIDDGWRLAPDLVDHGLDDALPALISESGDHARETIELLAARGVVAGLVAQLEESTRRMSGIVGTLKSYTQLDRAPVQLVDVRQGLDDTLLVLDADLAQITVKKEYAPDLPMIEAHGGELNQVWTNLIDNAADAIGETGRGEGTIVLRARADDDHVVVEVQDDGVGIPDANKGRIFDPFFTTKPPGSGTGLGLVVTYAIVTQRHGGRIEFDSRPGRTVARVRLPVRMSE